ncbi:A-agglutinin anchorage subunit-like [Beta vulgaris subsp. vulgaris]|uniref:A-agglutinin anchorage subunit-like n=1 Tax=Beta vulgaris subsp. vulgaris TaxID=3555 RepID=UPI0025467C81|nr:A-agglutinin anchorage subunit-like [Beta vulgaris subsp. vulgaris]
MNETTTTKTTEDMEMEITETSPSNAAAAATTTTTTTTTETSPSNANTTETSPSNATTTTTTKTTTTTTTAAAGDFLALARQLMEQDRTTQAFQTVVMGVRREGGQEAVYDILQRARHLYRSSLKASASAEADQLASLFADCVIAEAQHIGTQPPSSPLPLRSSSPAPPSVSVSESDSYEKSILAETGRKQIVLEAFSDGISFICLRCGGLVRIHLKDEHYTNWCRI